MSQGVVPVEIKVKLMHAIRTLLLASDRSTYKLCDIDPIPADKPWRQWDKRQIAFYHCAYFGERLSDDDILGPLQGLRPYWEILKAGNRLTDEQREAVFIFFQTINQSVLGVTSQAPEFRNPVLSPRQVMLIFDNLEREARANGSFLGFLRLVNITTAYDRFVTTDVALLARMLQLTLVAVSKAHYLADNAIQRKPVYSAVVQTLLKNAEKSNDDRILIPTISRFMACVPDSDELSRPYALLILGVLCNRLKRKDDGIRCVTEAERLVQERIAAAKSEGKSPNAADEEILMMAQIYLEKPLEAPAVPSPALAAASALGAGAVAVVPLPADDDLSEQQRGGSEAAQESKDWAP